MAAGAFETLQTTCKQSLKGIVPREILRPQHMALKLLQFIAEWVYSMQTRVLGCKKIMGKSQRGFSLIELLVVVAVILILAALAIPNFIRSKMQANEAAAVQNSRRFLSAASASDFSSSRYPQDGDS